jgi:hypothetical protein
MPNGLSAGMSGSPQRKTFEECDAGTRFRWAMQYLVCVLIVVFFVSIGFWFGYLYLPPELMMLFNFYLVMGVWVCDRQRRVAVRIDGTWNWRGWLRQIYWWMWWPYFVGLALKEKANK